MTSNTQSLNRRHDLLVDPVLPAMRLRPSAKSNWA